MGSKASKLLSVSDLEQRLLAMDKELSLLYSILSSELSAVLYFHHPIRDELARLKARLRLENNFTVVLPRSDRLGMVTVCPGCPSEMNLVFHSCGRLPTATPIAQTICDSLLDFEAYNNQGHSVVKEFDLNYDEQSGVNHIMANHKECLVE